METSASGFTPTPPVHHGAVGHDPRAVPEKPDAPPVSAPLVLPQAAVEALRSQRGQGPTISAEALRAASEVSGVAAVQSAAHSTRTGAGAAPPVTPQGGLSFVQPRIGLIVVGDEIISGAYLDQNLPNVRALLDEREMELSWVRIVRDDPKLLVRTFRETFASGDIVFSCGGLGSTPDDHTRQAVADALGVGLVLHPQVKPLIAEMVAQWGPRNGRSLDPDHEDWKDLRALGELPAGVEIIPNPADGMPGFFVRDHSFVPGFPNMAKPMIASVLDGRYAHLHHQATATKRELIVLGVPETDAAPLMRNIQAEFPGIKVYSLPSDGQGGEAPGPRIAMGVKGPEALIGPAFARLEAGLLRLGGRFESL